MTDEAQPAQDPQDETTQTEEAPQNTQRGVFVAVVAGPNGQEEYVPQIQGDIRFQEVEGILKGGLQTFIKVRGY